MLRVKLLGNDCFYGISDVLRLFGEPVSEVREESEVLCDNITADEVEIVAEIKDGEVYVYKSSEGAKASYRDEFYDAGNPKREIKRQLYKVMTEITGREVPWGALTGIRPTIPAFEVGDEETMSRKFFVREDKSRLAFETGMREREVLSRLPKDSLNAYVGIPFCPSRCAYCSFVSEDISHHMGRLKEYEAALEKELSLIGCKANRNISTLYVGRGTPTVLENAEFEKLINAVTTTLAFEDGAEITVEAGRPDTINEYKLRAMRNVGIGRICINPQTMSDETLRRFNRKHTAQDVVDVFEMARNLGFCNINMDLIAGLNGEYPEELLESVWKLVDLKPENITIHTLYKKRRASLSKDSVLGNREDSRLDTCLSKAYEMLYKAGYEPYYMYRQKDTSHGLENVGFALPGTECIYNVAMMSDKCDVVAFGAGGMSKRVFEGGRLERCSCIKDVLGYISSVEQMADKKLAFYEWV